MTLANNYAPIRQIGNGTTTQFSANWQMISATYAVVQLEDATSHTLTTVNQGVGSNQYQILLTSSGFTVTMGTAPTSGQYLNVSRSTSVDQTDSYRTSKGYQGEVEENSFDKLTAIVQENSNTLSRNINVPVGDTALLTLPLAGARANGFLSFDASGNVIVAAGITGVTVSSAMAPVVGAGTLVAARAAMGVPGLPDNNTFSGTNTGITPAAGDVTTKFATMANFAQGANGTSLVLLGTLTASNSASLIFTNITGFKTYKFVLNGIYPATTGANMLINISENNGTSFITSGYAGANIYLSPGGSVATGTSTSASAMYLTLGVTSLNAIIAPLNIEGTFYNFSNSTSDSSVSFYGSYTSTSSVFVQVIGSSEYQTDQGVINAVKFSFDNGNIVGGSISIFGVRST